MLLHATETLTAASEAALSMSEKSSIALSTTLTGLVVVFLALILLTFVISVFGKVVGGAATKAAKPAPAPAPAAPAPVAPVAEVVPVGETADCNDDEIIAVIAAAVYAYGEASGKKYAVRSVRPSGRSNWAAAGVIENTRPF